MQHWPRHLTAVAPTVAVLLACGPTGAWGRRAILEAHLRAAGHETRARAATRTGQPATEPALPAETQDRFGLIPTPAPQLDAWVDGQPADTALGKLLVSGLDGSTRTSPPPTQGSINLAEACPILQDWPDSVEVDAPDSCKSLGAGAWAVPGGILGFREPLVTWQQKCWLQAPTITYTMPNGDLFGSSQTSGMLFGKTAVLYDCKGMPVYSVQEKAYHQKGKANPLLCEKYKSCDGIVWLQYFIRRYSDGRTVAKTPYLNLFQDAFDVEDMKGTVVASVSREGGWSPMCGECGEPRKWVINFPKRDEEGVFFKPTDQWPIAEMVTIMSVRDASRRSTGLVGPSTCELRSYALEFVFAFLLVAAIVVALVFFIRTGLHPTREFCFKVEKRVFPKRTGARAK